MFKVVIDLKRFSVIELIALIAIINICLIVFITCIVGLWRPMRLEVIANVYRLLDQMLALIAGLLGGSVMTKLEKPKNILLKKEEN